MKKAKRAKERRSKEAVAEPRRLWKVLAIVVMVGCAALALAVRAYNRREAEAVNSRTLAPTAQGVAPRKKTNSKLSLQPEANRMRNRLGQRFVSDGREVSLLVGTLTTGKESRQVQIIRAQEDDGEKVEIQLAGARGLLIWSSAEGAMSDGRPATGEERALIERLALDSADQFVLAQLRGASYYTLARDARPEEAGDSEDYQGPLWDIVRLTEPEMERSAAPQSPSRVYYINVSTGLIDKIVSSEGEDTITAEVADWRVWAGEIVPAQITWSLNGQIIMRLDLSNASHGQSQ